MPTVLFQGRYLFLQRYFGEEPKKYSNFIISEMNEYEGE